MMQDTMENGAIMMDEKSFWQIAEDASGRGEVAT